MCVCALPVCVRALLVSVVMVVGLDGGGGGGGEEDLFKLFVCKVSKRPFDATCEKLGACGLGLGIRVRNKG